MTQIITSCNAIPAGKTYQVAGLRTAESIQQLCEYIDAAHPIANDVGNNVYCLRRTSEDAFTYQVFWNDTLLSVDVLEKDLLATIKLAPLAYRNCRPLHVGDEITLRILGVRWDAVVMSLELVDDVGFDCGIWRFADEVTG